MTMSPAPTRARRTSRIALAAASFAAALLLLEVGWRIVLRARGTPFDSGAARAEIEQLFASAREFVPRVGAALPENPVDAQPGGRVLHPYQAWENIGGMAQAEDEVRRLDDQDRAADFEIVVVGGSVADMFGVLGVPRLAELLREDPRLASRRVEFFRHGRGGYKQPQQLANVAWMLGQGFSPDVVINIDGFNEVALGNDNARRGTSPLYPSIPHWGTLAAAGVADRDAIDHASRGRAAQEDLRWWAKNALRARLHVSALAATVSLRWLHALRAQQSAAFEAYAESLASVAAERILKGPPFGSRAEDVARQAVLMWKESSRSLRAVCEARGILYLHVLQPTLHDAGSKTLTPEEIRTGGAIDSWIEGVRLGYPLLRAAGAELALEGERFVDATGLFARVERTLYIDSCHFAEDGNRLLAETIGTQLLRHLTATR